jgi:RNA polymerase sigma factor (sigma-70 family)
MRSNENADLVNEALAVVFNNYKKVEFKSGILAYAYGVLLNIQRKKDMADITHPFIINENRDAILEKMGYKEESTEEFDGLFVLEDLYAAIEKLNPRQRDLIRMKLEGYSTEEIMEHFHLSENAVNVMYYFARKKLEKYLKAKGY